MKKGLPFRRHNINWPPIPAYDMQGHAFVGVEPGQRAISYNPCILSIRSGSQVTRMGNRHSRKMVPTCIEMNGIIPW